MAGTDHVLDLAGWLQRMRHSRWRRFLFRLGALDRASALAMTQRGGIVVHLQSLGEMRRSESRNHRGH